jgi:hypothetical protein
LVILNLKKKNFLNLTKFKFFFEGTKSIAIHEKQCIENRKKINENLPANQQLTIPQKPVEFNINNKKLTIDEMNEKSYQSYIQNLKECNFNFNIILKLFKI